MTQPRPASRLDGSAAGWRAVRRALNQNRPALTAAAAGLHGDVPKVAGTGLLCWPAWLPAEPLDLAALPLRWSGEPPPPAVDGTLPAAAHVLPRQASGQPYPGYAAAIEALDRPGLFENRACYRLLSAASPVPAAPVPAAPVPAAPVPAAPVPAAPVPAAPVPAAPVPAAPVPAARGPAARGPAARGPAASGSAAPEPGAPEPGMCFTSARYFDAVNLGHAVAHELAAAWLADPGGVRLAGLPLRAAVGDPCDLRRRSAITAVTTLTLRRAPGGAASFLLHWRDPARVNHAGGLYQVMPAGIFQPVTDAAAALRSDLSLWRCMAREFSEELLGGSEEYPTRDGVLDYEQWPFYRELTAARDCGRVRVSYVGLGVDPLTLATDILTVAVFDAAVFDSLFRGLVPQNAEGRLVTEHGSAAIPFTAATIGRLTDGAAPVQAAGAALLRLAWQHRRALLG